MTFQSAASHPTSRTLRGGDEGETGDGVVGESDMTTEKWRHSGLNLITITADSVGRQ